VFTKEPPAADSKLVLHENVTVTPHLGASTVEAQVCLIVSEILS
jgi:D-3-phosphoglycerate dehydrogenase